MTTITMNFSDANYKEAIISEAEKKILLNAIRKRVITVVYALFYISVSIFLFKAGLAEHPDTSFYSRLATSAFQTFCICGLVTFGFRYLKEMVVYCINILRMPAGNDFYED